MILDAVAAGAGVLLAMRRRAVGAKRPKASAERVPRVRGATVSLPLKRVVATVAVANCADGCRQLPAVFRWFLVVVTIAHS